jgi:hypothetical protein
MKEKTGQALEKEEEQAQLYYTDRSVFSSFSAIFSRKMQKLPLFACILIRNEGKNRSQAGLCEARREGH